MRWQDRLFDLDLSPHYHVGPFASLLAHERCEFLSCPWDNIDAHGRHTLLKLWICECFPHSLCELGLYGYGQFGRGDYSPPGSRIKCSERQACLTECWNIRV